MPQEQKKGESCIFNPFFGISLLGACFVSGFGWIPYALGMMVASNVIGYYTEAKINELDAVTRQKIAKITKTEQPNDAKELGELVRKTNQTLGVFCPPIPLISLGCGWYMSYKARKLAEVGDGETRQANEITLAPGFAAEGRCLF